MTLMAAIATAAVSGNILLGAAAPIKVAVIAPGHTPKVNTHWNYSVRVTESGKPASGRITEQIVDPIGAKHPVDYGTSTKPITNRPFKGVFRDFIVWPASSRGIPLELRIVVVVGKTRRVVDYAVTPRA
jgi:hypothetical protein